MRMGDTLRSLLVREVGAVTLAKDVLTAAKAASRDFKDFSPRDFVPRLRAMMGKRFVPEKPRAVRRRRGIVVLGYRLKDAPTPGEADRGLVQRIVAELLVAAPGAVVPTGDLMDAATDIWADARRGESPWLNSFTALLRRELGSDVVPTKRRTINGIKGAVVVGFRLTDAAAAELQQR